MKEYQVFYSPDSGGGGNLQEIPLLKERYSLRRTLIISGLEGVGKNSQAAAISQACGGTPVVDMGSLFREVDKEGITIHKTILNLMADAFQKDFLKRATPDKPFILISRMGPVIAAEVASGENLLQRKVPKIKEQNLAEIRESVARVREIMEEFAIRMFEENWKRNRPIQDKPGPFLTINLEIANREERLKRLVIRESGKTPEEWEKLSEKEKEEITKRVKKKEGKRHSRYRRQLSTIYSGIRGLSLFNSELVIDGQKIYDLTLDGSELSKEETKDRLLDKLSQKGAVTKIKSTDIVYERQKTTDKIQG